MTIPSYNEDHGDHNWVSTGLKKKKKKKLESSSVELMVYFFHGVWTPAAKYHKYILIFKRACCFLRAKFGLLPKC